MCGIASRSDVSVHRASIFVASVTNRTNSPAELRLRFQTASRTFPSAFAGNRSYGALQSASPQPCPSTPSCRMSYQRTPSASVNLSGSAAEAQPHPAVRMTKARTTVEERIMANLLEGTSFRIEPPSVCRRKGAHQVRRGHRVVHVGWFPLVPKLRLGTHSRPSSAWCREENRRRCATPGVARPDPSTRRRPSPEAELPGESVPKPGAWERGPCASGSGLGPGAPAERLQTAPAFVVP
jgi:hypothetical protein